MYITRGQYGVSSCGELLKNKVLTYCIWVLGVLAFVGNLVVILLRIIRKDISRVNSFLLVGNRCKSNKHSLDPNSSICLRWLLRILQGVYKKGRRNETCALKYVWCGGPHTAKNNFLGKKNFLNWRNYFLKQENISCLKKKLLKARHFFLYKKCFLM